MVRMIEKYLVLDGWVTVKIELVYFVVPCCLIRTWISAENVVPGSLDEVYDFDEWSFQSPNQKVVAKISLTSSCDAYTYEFTCTTQTQKPHVIPNKTN